MSSQAAFARLASAMRKAVKRKSDESDSEDSVDMITNRGNKLRKRARYVREGKLAPPSGPEVYKRTITHAGFERDIISRRPTLYDVDGFEIESEDDDEGAQAASAATADFYPYSEVRIENLLAPLTSPGDLPDHPTLSRPFTSKPLTDLTRQARELVQKEKAALWRMKHLLTLMSGDHTWIPCEILETENDINLFDDGSPGYREHLLEKTRLKHNHEFRLAPSDGTLEEKTVAAANMALDEMQAPPDVVENAMPEAPAAEDDVAMIDASNETPVELVPEITNETPNEATMQERPSEATMLEAPSEATVQSESNHMNDAAAPMNSEDNGAEESINLFEVPIAGENKLAETVPTVKIDGGLEVPQLGLEVEDPGKAMGMVQVPDPDDEEAAQDQEDVPEPRRMRTRAQAQAASDNNTTVSRPRSTTPSTNSSYIHPYFLAPPSAHPTPDMGLPSVEAEETRRLLQLYIQKQEEICRGSQKLYDGLMRAERLRKTVLKWAKAEGHLGEMSDGEDWYDKEEWGLSEDLKKGQDEEEEDAATTAKKTRTRRQ